MHAADPALRKQRKQKGGNTGKNFTEGWVEFEDKAVAKQVAAMLNSNPIGGKRRSAYHYDLWSLKYLPKFKWDHLTEEIGVKSICSAVFTLLLGLNKPMVSLQCASAEHHGKSFSILYSIHNPAGSNAGCYALQSF